VLPNNVPKRHEEKAAEAAKKLISEKEIDSGLTG
jgi:hypothetical protein